MKCKGCNRNWVSYEESLSCPKVCVPSHRPPCPKPPHPDCCEKDLCTDVLEVVICHLLRDCGLHVDTKCCRKK